ncbi:MAG: pirin family protein [Burkholderiaceae bacterium]
MLQQVIEQRRLDLGGFEVGRVLPHRARQMVGPFIFFDHFGPARFERGVARSVDVRPHPHIGLSTVTYLFKGEVMHRDSVGSEQAIRPGEVNWMVAGRGITHSERFEKGRAEGGPMHGIQAWVALPREHEETAPGFANYSSDQLPTHEEGGVWMRLIAGEVDGLRAGAKTHSPMFYAHLRLARGASISLPSRYSERAVFVVSGTVAVDEDQSIGGQMMVFAPRSDAVVFAQSDAVLMMLGGEPVGERFIEWNFVSSSRQRIEQAKEDWRAGRMKLPDLDHDEFIPLPPDPPAAAGPMS